MSSPARHLPALLLATLAAGALAEGPAKEAGKPPDPAADINQPREGSRKISFDVSEATWSSVDVSPDGKTLVFDLLGDLYTLPITGGAATPLTSGPAFDQQPRFSPDGKTIAFASDRGGLMNLWMIDADGKNARPITSEKDAYVRSPAWTPDGLYLVARREDAKRAGIPPVELWMFHREGGAGIKLVSSEEAQNSSGPVASKDGRSLYYSARARKFDYTPNLRDGLWHIQRYDRDLGRSVPITSGFGGAARPALSPDGRTLVFVSRRDDDSALLARDLASGAERVLLRPVSRDEMEGFAQQDLWPNYAFTPDGAALIFSSHGKLQRLEVATGAVREIPFTARVEQSVAQRVTFQDRVEQGPVKARILRWPSQSGDGKSLAFQAFGRVHLQDLAPGAALQAKGAPRRLNPDDAAPREYAPAFSPDGQWVAFVTWSDAEGGHVWKVRAAPGFRPVKLTKRAGHYMSPAWSPDGARLLVVRGTGLEQRGHQPEEDDWFDLALLDAAGGEAASVTPFKGSDSLQFHPRAFWSADGKRIYYREGIEPKKPGDDPKADLVSVRLDGTDLKRHLRFPVVDDLVPSPDDKWIAFTSRDNVYLTAFPGALTKEPPEVNLKEGAVPVLRLSDDAGGHVRWTEGGKALTWGLANTFYRLPLAAALDFAREQRAKAEAEAKARAMDGGKGGDEAEKAKDKEKDARKKEEEPRVPKAQTLELTVTAPRAVPEGSLVLRGARVVTMQGDAVLEDTDVVVAGNRIVGVGPTGKVPAPAGAKVYDAKGKTVVPGLIDTHAHLHYSGFELFPDAKWEYFANLAYGVTTVYDPSAPSLDVFAQAEEIEAGLLTGPRVYSSGDVLYGGQQAPVYAEVNSLEDARRQVRRMKAYGARMIKVYQQPKRSQRIWFAEACRELHMLLTSEGAGELDTDLTMALDGFTAWEHALPVALHKDVVTLFARSQTFYTPTLLVAYGGPWGEQYFWQTMNPHDDPKLGRFVPHPILDVNARRHPWIWPAEYQFPTVARGAAEVLRAGGNVSLGAHGQLQGLGPHWELWAMAGEGQLGAANKAQAMTPLEALRASTRLAAEKLGLGQDLGTIEPGKLADLVVLDQNPLEDIHHSTSIRWVVKNGEVFEGETMKKVGPREAAPPKFFWAK